MRVGIHVDLRNPPPWRRPWAEHYARWLELIEHAEGVGASSVWFAEHHFFEDGFLPQPLTFASAVAARTNRVRIGTAVYLAALRPAVQIAEDAALVDLVSGGRLDLGFGAGYRVPEYTGYSADRKRRFSSVLQRVRDVRRLWDEGAVTPPPVQKPVPIWLAFNKPRWAREAGLLGTGLLPTFRNFPRESLDAYREGLRESGHDPSAGRLAGTLENIMLADDPEDAWPRVRPHLEYQWNSYLRYMVEGTDEPVRTIDPDRWRLPGPRGEPPRFQILTPEDAARFVREFLAGLPVGELFFWASFAGMPDDLVQRNIELICGKLAPSVADL